MKLAARLDSEILSVATKVLIVLKKRLGFTVGKLLIDLKNI